MQLLSEERENWAKEDRPMKFDLPSERLRLQLMSEERKNWAVASL
jgi:hypothetical protein